MSYYVCKGKTNYWATLNKPIYKDNYFADFFNYWVGYAKSPQELNISYPFPNEYKDSEGLIWQLKNGTKPDNHQFGNSRERIPKSQLDWTPRTEVKYQDPKPKWNSTNSNTPGLWKNLKKKGLV